MSVHSKHNPEDRIFKLEVWAEHSHICKGCGKPLGDQFKSHYHSHIVRRSRSNELKRDKRNITEDCLKCHNKWDSGQIRKQITLRNFHQRMSIIKELNTELYGIMVDKMSELDQETINEYGLNKYL